MDKSFLKAAGIRAIKTIAQTILSMITLGMGIFDVDWKMVLSVSIVSGIYSILTSIVSGLPELESNGELILERDSEDMLQFRLKANDIKDGMKIIVRDTTGDINES